MNLLLQISYNDAGAAGTIKVKGKSISLDKSYDETVLASGSNLRMLLAAMPLKKDLSTSIQGLNEQQR